MRSGYVAGGLLATAIFAFQAPVSAEDLDLFVQPPGEVVGKPNVLIVLDNTANWSRTVAGQAINVNELKALAGTIDSLEENKFRVGLMLFTETGSPNSNTDGGYLRAAIRDMTPDNKAKYSAQVRSLHELDDKSNGGKAGKTMSEVYQYFTGKQPFSGNQKVKTDYQGNDKWIRPQDQDVYALVDDVTKKPNNGNALRGFEDTVYNSPIEPDSCGGNYIIYISNGAAQDNNADTKEATRRLAGAALAEEIPSATTAIPISPSGSQDNVADEWARFLRRSSVNAVTYTIDVDPVTTGQGPGWTALLRSMAGVSNGKYFVATSANAGESIANALGLIFSEIQAVNSVFASVSLPVSVNTEGTFLNQVYIGMFRPDQNAYPRWVGNLKQYKLGLLDPTSLRTLDADSQLAINPLTGFISECARSFWTPTTTDTYWTFKPQGSCLTIPGADNSNYPDGNIVEKGAQAYKLRSSTARTVKTCSATDIGSCTTILDFNSTNVSASLLGAATTAERDTLISWARGLDVPVPSPNPDSIDGDENVNGVTMTEMRPSVHGDVVHSRPVAVNFGTDAARKVVVFYGGNDGVLRAVNGNRSENIGGFAAGSEMWAFIPPEFSPHIKQLRDNNRQIQFKDNPVENPLPKPYGIDGPLAVYQDSLTNPTKSWLYAGMRRGGRVLYAFDVVGYHSASLTSPRLLWKKGCDAAGVCSSGFSGIGQTWSAPKVLKTGGYRTPEPVAQNDPPSVPKPMLIMGGGYDTCEDDDPRTCGTNPQGSLIYVLDAETGSVIKTLNTDASVVGDVFVVPDGASGLAKLAYAADMLGNVYRIAGKSDDQPFATTHPSDWTITKIAALGCDDGSDSCVSRKFMFAPDVVAEDGVYYILIGSGDREKPVRNYLEAYKTSNYFFMVVDNPADPAGGPINMGSLVEIYVDAESPTTVYRPDLADTPKGWALALGPKEGDQTDLYACRAGSLATCHEQVVTSAITVFGVTTFSTHTPTEPKPGACTSNLGLAKVYNIRFRNAASATDNPRDQPITGGGLPPSPVAGMVTLDDGTTVPFLIGGSPDSPLEGSLPVGQTAVQQPKSVTYWYIQK